VSGYQLVSTGLVSLSVAGNGTTTLTVTCPTGKRVLGGGHESSAGFNLQPVASYPLTVDTWKVTLRLNQESAATVQLRVYALCANVLN
jgi:hypothetical protein